MKKKVLFLCTHNSARSQMAEGLLNTLYGETYQAYSAGTQPVSTVNPYAVKVMKEIGIDISDHRPKNRNEFRGIFFDYVITVCDNAREACPFFPGGQTIHKSFEDPSSFSGSEDEILGSFRRLRNEIKDWIESIFIKKNSKIL